MKRFWIYTFLVVLVSQTQNKPGWEVIRCIWQLER